MIVICINNNGADALQLGRIYEAVETAKFSNDYVIDGICWEKTRFELLPDHDIMIDANGNPVIIITAQKFSGPIAKSVKADLDAKEEARYRQILTTNATPGECVCKTPKHACWIHKDM